MPDEALSKHAWDVERLLQEHADALILYARPWVGAAAEDVVQDAFLKLLDAERLPDTPKAWLYRVVRNASIDQSRRGRFCRQAPLENWFESIAVEEEITFDGEELTRTVEYAGFSFPTSRRTGLLHAIWPSGSLIGLVGATATAPGTT